MSKIDITWQFWHQCQNRLQIMSSSFKTLPRLGPKCILLTAWRKQTPPPQRGLSGGTAPNPFTTTRQCTDVYFLESCWNRTDISSLKRILQYLSMLKSNFSEKSFTLWYRTVKKIKCFHSHLLNGKISRNIPADLHNK